MATHLLGRINVITTKNVVRVLLVLQVVVLCSGLPEVLLKVVLLFLRTFHLPFEAEFTSFILMTEKAWKFLWNVLWIEYDFIYLINLFKIKSAN